jgi:diadenylate cyclase
MGFLDFAIEYLRWQDIVDILLVSIIIYNALVWSQGNRSRQLLQGIMIIFLLYLLSHWLKFYTLDWLLQKLATIFLIAVIIVFQPELRAALEKLGRSSKLGLLFSEDSGSKSKTAIYNRIIKAVLAMSEQKIGSLIVLQQTTGLENIIESGTELDASTSYELLLSIFHGKNPLHDGAIVIKDEKIAAAGCLLPLSESKLTEKHLGTRHRAALGLSEQSDSITIVTSEETGIISIAHNHNLTRYLTKETLEEHLFAHTIKETDEKFANIKSLRELLRKDISKFKKIKKS